LSASTNHEVAKYLSTSHRPSSPPLRLLCIDHEGGRGGSSRSLYNLLTALDPQSIKPTVWCRRDSELVDEYRQHGIPCAVKEWIPNFRVQNATLSTLANIKSVMGQIWRAKKEIWNISSSYKGDFDLVHLNYESLLLFGFILKQALGIELTMHMRTRTAHSFFLRLQNILISRLCQNVVFITDNEKEHYLGCGGSVDGPIIFNPIPVRGEPPVAKPDLELDKRTKIAMIGNFGWKRGHDRLIEIANALAEMGRGDEVLFVVAGHLSMPNNLPPPFDETVRSGGDFAAHVSSLGLERMFSFLGHVSDPERVIVSCDAVIKPSHRNEPWGRDVIEAMFFGKPVLATGTWDSPFVNEMTGILFPEFDANAFAEAIISIVDDPARFITMGNEGAKRIQQICSLESRADEFGSFWMNAIGDHHSVQRDL
jgi:glycosyltransferase involved in cell wall biosynthesis